MYLRKFIGSGWRVGQAMVVFAAAAGFAVAVAPMPVGAQAAGDTHYHISKTVQALGANGHDLAADVDVLTINPHEAVHALVFELHPIPRKAYYPGQKTRDEQHIVSILRALHYLTGTTFSARTSAKLSDDEKQFLDFNKEMHDENPTHEIHFFGVWMSRDADYLAPADAQREIIRKWKEWEQTHGKTFEYHPAKKFKEAWDDWYWYG